MFTVMIITDVKQDLSMALSLLNFLAEGLLGCPYKKTVYGRAGKPNQALTWNNKYQCLGKFFH